MDLPLLLAQAANTSCRSGGKGTDTLRHGGEHGSRDRHLGALESDAPGLAHHLCPDLYELQLDASARPVGNISWKGEAEEVAEIVCQHERGGADLVGGEASAGKSLVQASAHFPSPIHCSHFDRQGNRPRRESATSRVVNVTYGPFPAWVPRNGSRTTAPLKTPA